MRHETEEQDGIIEPGVVKVKKTITLLTAPKATFVSIVPNGANQRPFRVVKSDDGEEESVAKSLDLYRDPFRKAKKVLKPKPESVEKCATTAKKGKKLAGLAALADAKRRADREAGKVRKAGRRYGSASRQGLADEIRDLRGVVRGTRQPKYEEMRDEAEGDLAFFREKAKRSSAARRLAKRIIAARVKKAAKTLRLKNKAGIRIGRTEVPGELRVFEKGKGRDYGYFTDDRADARATAAAMIHEKRRNSRVKKAAKAGVKRSYYLSSMAKELNGGNVYAVRSKKNPKKILGTAYGRTAAEGHAHWAAQGKAKKARRAGDKAAVARLQTLKAKRVARGSTGIPGWVTRMRNRVKKSLIDDGFEPLAIYDGGVLFQNEDGALCVRKWFGRGPSRPRKAGYRALITDHKGRTKMKNLRARTSAEAASRMQAKHPKARVHISMR